MSSQITGAVGGAVLANLMFDLPAVTWSDTRRSAGHLWLGEVVATAGLILLIVALAPHPPRRRRGARRRGVHRRGVLVHLLHVVR